MSHPGMLNDADLERAYQAMLRQRGANRSDCVTPEHLLAIVESRLDETERLAVLRHVGTCAHCRRELEMLRLAADAALQAQRPAWQRAPWLAAAAVLVLLLGGVGLWSRMSPSGIDTPRAGDAAALRLVAPLDSAALATPLQLVWSAVGDARRYEIEILDEASTPVFTATATDTTVAVERVAAGGYRWWVRAVLSDGSEVRSTVRRLRITNP